MTTDERDHGLELRRIVDGLVDSILEAPEEEIDDDLRAVGEDPEEAAERTRQVIQDTLKRHRKGRLARARREYEESVVALARHDARLPATPMARRELLVAAFDAQPRLEQMLTVQFRELEDLPDEDVASCLRQLAALGVLDELLD